jgi:hypothetical protein
MGIYSFVMTIFFLKMINLNCQNSVLKLRMLCLDKILKMKSSSLDKHEFHPSILTSQI